MSTTGTLTNTFTTADIRKVIEHFAADFSMMVLFTGLHSREYVTKVAHDLNVFADFRCITEVKLMLKDKVGNKLNASVYKISEAATGWTCERPGNNNWPRTPDGTLLVIGTMTQTWHVKTDAEKAAFRQKQGLNWPWNPTTQDVSVLGMTATAGQTYASNGYGIQRTNYGR
jgi:hypothetical protein